MTDKHSNFIILYIKCFKKYFWTPILKYKRWLYDYTTGYPSKYKFLKFINTNLIEFQSLEMAEKNLMDQQIMIV